MRVFLYCALMLATLVALEKESVADVYKFVDSTGHVFYTDHPSHAGYRRIIRTPITVRANHVYKTPMLGRGLASSMTRTSVSPTLARNRREFAGLIEAAASKYSLDPALLHAIVRAESSYNPDAVSNKGAVGLMQLMPATAARYGVRDRRDPVENIDGGARYLSELMEMFQSDLRLTVAAYNAGENSVKRHGYKVPPIPETQDYVVRVLDYYRRRMN